MYNPMFTVLIFILISINLHASSKYILLTKVKNKQQLKYVHNKLNKLNVKTFYKKTTNNEYIIYTNKFSSNKYLLNKLKKYFPHARISNDTKNKEREQTSENFYIGLGIGYNSSPSTQKINNININVKEPNNSGLGYNIDIGYIFKNNFSIAVGYMNFNTSDIMFDNVYSAINYRFSNFNNISPFFGALVGYSSLRWSTPPLIGAADDSSSNSDSIFGGTQAGIIYKGFTPSNIYIAYQCLFMNHKTNIETDSSIKHNTLHTLQLGFQYNF